MYDRFLNRFLGWLLGRFFSRFLSWLLCWLLGIVFQSWFFQLELQRLQLDKRRHDCCSSVKADLVSSRILRPRSREKGCWDRKKSVVVLRVGGSRLLVCGERWEMMREEATGWPPGGGILEWGDAMIAVPGVKG